MDKEKVKEEIIKIEKKLEELRKKLEEPKITKSDIYPGAIFVNELVLDDFIKNKTDIENLHHIVIIKCEYSKNLFSLAGLYGTLSNYSNQQAKTADELAKYLNAHDYKLANDLFKYRLVKRC
jgi:hypothetical protein